MRSIIKSFSLYLITWLVDDHDDVFKQKALRTDEAFLYQVQSSTNKQLHQRPHGDDTMTARKLSFILIVSLAISSNALTIPTPRSVVIWHGMGDHAQSKGMQSVKAFIEEEHPGIYVHVIQLADKDDADRNAGFFGNINEQVDTVCNQLAADSNLTSEIDAIGFSQGGQFLRAYVQRCNAPKVHNLITFGSQHNGVADLPACENNDGLCSLMRGIARWGVYTDYVQRQLIQAQYYNDPKKHEAYLEKSIFLPDLNNELTINKTYAKNLASLNRLVLIMFSEDETVVPRETAWFGWYVDGEKSDEIAALQQLPIYKQDRIGLKLLDNREAIDFLICEGAHMRFTDEYLRNITLKYLGGRVSKKDDFVIQDPSAETYVF